MKKVKRRPLDYQAENTKPKLSLENRDDLLILHTAVNRTIETQIFTDGMHYSDKTFLVSTHVWPLALQRYCPSHS